MSEPVKVHEMHRLVGASFLQPIQFAGVSTSLNVTRDMLEPIVPARLEADGSCVAIDKGQRAEGLRFRRKQTDRIKGRTVMAESFVPWANIAEVLYGE